MFLHYTNEQSRVKVCDTVDSFIQQCLVTISLFKFCYSYKRIFILQILWEHHIIFLYFRYITYISSEGFWFENLKKRYHLEK
jgi:hypothetical protein